MTPEQFVPLALFVLFVVFNLVGRWVSGRLKQQQEREEEQPVPPPSPGRERPIPPRARVVTTPKSAPEELRPAPRPPGRAERRRRRPRPLLETPSEARRAIVLMAILGPCRGREADGPDGMR